jgi:hypothetical protein
MAFYVYTYLFNFIQLNACRVACCNQLVLYNVLFVL